jgi:hypothetical protein
MSASFLSQCLLSSCVNAHRVRRVVQTPSIVHERQPTLLFMECESGPATQRAGWPAEQRAGWPATQRESGILGQMIAHWEDEETSRKRICIMEKERRSSPRIDFHHDVIVNRSRKIRQIRNFSLGGAFIQTENPSEFAAGRRISLFLKFPLEAKPMVMHAQIAHIENQGIGVKFVDLMGRNADAVEYNFEVFKVTLPLPGT